MQGKLGEGVQSVVRACLEIRTKRVLAVKVIRSGD
jgi:calcium-dependent protein kinase